MPSQFFTSIFVDIPRTETGRLLKVIRKAAGTKSCDVWLPWTHRVKNRLDDGVQVFVRHDVGLAAGPGAQDPRTVGRRFAHTIWHAFGVECAETIQVIHLDNAPWVSAHVEDPLVAVAVDAQALPANHPRRARR